MTKIEALELELNARKMVDGTELDWTDVIQCEGVKQTCFKFDMPIGTYELALGIIEGKPVWVDSILFDKYGVSQCAKHISVDYLSHWSWNPPKPKTVMVELRIDVAERFANDEASSSAHLALACRKALENLK